MRLRRVGNSYTLTLPVEFVAELGLEQGADLEVFVREDRVVYEPAVSSWDALTERLRRQAAERGVGDADVDRAVAEERRSEPER